MVFIIICIFPILFFCFVFQHINMLENVQFKFLLGFRLYCEKVNKSVGWTNRKCSKCLNKLYHIDRVILQLRKIGLWMSGVNIWNVNMVLQWKYSICVERTTHRIVHPSEKTTTPANKTKYLNFKWKITQEIGQNPYQHEYIEFCIAFFFV